MLQKMLAHAIWCCLLLPFWAIGQSGNSRTLPSPKAIDQSGRAPMIPQLSVATPQYRSTPDTFKCTLQQVERIFLDSNLGILAAHYNIESARALEEQARKWDNPLLITDQNIYANKKFFAHGRNADGTTNGQVFVQVQQLIKTAGKRGKLLDLAQTNTAINYWQFQDVLRNLRFELRKDFVTLAALQKYATLYSENLDKLLQLQTVMQTQYNAGNIALKEYLRIQSLIINVQTRIAENETNISDVQSELKTLLQLSGNVIIVPVGDALQPKALAVGIQAILDSAVVHNTTYNQQLQQWKYSQQNLRLQQAIAVPDLTAGVEYDQNSNYTPNYYGLALNIPIPLFDRNQGNIKSAKWQIKAEEARATQLYNKLQNDVFAAYEKWSVLHKMNTQANDTFYVRYQKLFGNIAQSFNNRQISLVEFLAYFNDYQDVQAARYNNQLNQRLAQLTLDDVVGIDLGK